MSIDQAAGLQIEQSTSGKSQSLSMDEHAMLVEDLHKQIDDLRKTNEHILAELEIHELMLERAYERIANIENRLLRSF